MEQALVLLREAIEHDRNKQYDQAISKYILACEYLLDISEKSRNKKERVVCKDKALLFIQRCEYLQQVKRCNPVESSTTNNIKPIVTSDNQIHVSWNDVIGLENAKEALRQALVLPNKFPSVFSGSHRPWTGILLYGPPGTGKTHLARAAACECKATFYYLSASDILSKWVGDSEKNVKEYFEEARKHAPSLIFIDEIDSLCMHRSLHDDRVSRTILTEFLTQMQGITSNEGVLVLAATNRFNDLDIGILRRFEKQIAINLPNSSERTQLFKLKLLHFTTKDYSTFASLTPATTGADIDVIARDAHALCLHRLEQASFFRLDPVTGKYTPCKTGDKKTSLYDLPYDSLAPLQVTRQDVLDAIARQRGNDQSNSR